MLKKRQNLSVKALNQQLLESLDALRNDPMERAVFEYFDFLAWARSQCEHKKYRELLAA